MAVTATCLVAWRLLAAIPLPITLFALSHPTVQSSNPTAGLVGIFKGSSFESGSVIALGLGPFLAAFVVFWLWGVVNRKVLVASRDPDRTWTYLTWLTVIIATLQGFFLTSALVGDQPRILTSTVGLLTIVALVVGTMTIFWLGRLIQKFGIPAGYGVWLLFGIESLMKGVHHVARWIDADSGDSAIPAILATYAVVSIALLVSVVIVIDLAMPLNVQRQSDKVISVERTAFVFHFFEGGLFIPIIFAVGFSNAILVMLSILRVVNLQAHSIWIPFSPLNWFAVGYHVAVIGLIFAGCFFAMWARVDPRWLARKLRKAGEVIAGIPPGEATARYVAAVTTMLMLFGAAWLALVVDVIPLAFHQLVLQSRPHLQVGGGPFVIAATIMVSAVSRGRRQIWA